MIYLYVLQFHPPEVIRDIFNPTIIIALQNPTKNKLKNILNILKAITSQSEMQRKRIVDGINSSVIYLIYCKNFCKCHNVFPPSTTIKKEHFSFSFYLKLYRSKKKTFNIFKVCFFNFKKFFKLCS
jgi:hypothetical protein